MHHLKFIFLLPLQGIILMLLFQTFACTSANKGLILSQDEFKEVLKELLIADNGVETLGLKPEERSRERERRYQLIYQKFNLSPEIFLINFEYYRERPALMDAIYSQIIDEISEMLTSRQLPSNPLPMPAFTPSPK